MKTMIKNNEKSAEILRAEEQLAQAKARLAEAKRKEGARKRKEENQHKYMMGGIVHKYFPECYQFFELELNRIIEIVKKESAEKSGSAFAKSESEVANDEGAGKGESA